MARTPHPSAPSAPGIAARAALWLIGGYRHLFSPFVGRSCRFVPSCSRYAALCFAHQPFWRALCNTAWHVARCQPLCEGGFEYPTTITPNAFYALPSSAVVHFLVPKDAQHCWIVPAFSAPC